MEDGRSKWTIHTQLGIFRLQAYIGWLHYRHIKEHYEGKATLDESQMTPEELEFHYFK